MASNPEADGDAEVRDTDSTSSDSNSRDSTSRDSTSGLKVGLIGKFNQESEASAPMISHAVRGLLFQRARC